MAESLIESDVHEFKSALFSDFLNELEGEFGPSLAEGDVDWSLQHEDWPNRFSMLRIADRRCPSAAISSYGYTVYRDWLEEPNPPSNVYLDSRVFAPEVSLRDILAEAAWCAIEEKGSDTAIPIVKSLIDYVAAENFSDQAIRQYLDLAIASNNYEIIRMYVDFANSHTVKGPDDAKVFLKKMAHAVAGLPTEAYRSTGGEVEIIQKQILLEDIGHSWIRKSMPVVEIDWLP